MFLTDFLKTCSQGIKIYIYLKSKNKMQFMGDNIALGNFLAKSKKNYQINRIQIPAKNCVYIYLSEEF